MLFNTIEYLFLLLPVAILGFRLLGRGPLNTSQLVWLVACSLFFYATWNPVYLLLILGSILGNYFFGRALGRSAGGNTPLLALGITFNLGLLGYFKYTGFFLDNLNSLVEWAIPVPHITLPLAISFFTFQQIAYLVDVHRGDARDYSFLHYCLFVTFFPQLIAGPIVHHKEMMPQFDAPERNSATLTDIQVGLTIITLGLAKKVLLADNLAIIADPLFMSAQNGATLTMAEAWIAVLAFTGQIYFDFSGYTDMAIGSARLFGIRLPENFYSPYRSFNIIEFWRRWHITLSRFLRDYLYISMGGNRKGRVKRYRNLLLTMLLGGLWHGAHWNFVIWGGLHGSYLVINHFWHHICRSTGFEWQRIGVAGRVISWSLTFLAVIIAWVFFRAQSTPAALSILTSMATPDSLAIKHAYMKTMISLQPMFDVALNTIPGLTPRALIVGFIGFALAISVFAPNTQQLLRHFEPALVERPWPAFNGIAWRPTIGWAVAVGVLAYLSLLNLGNRSEFIYFQF